MISTTFIFRPGEYDETFYQLDAAIASAARGIDGFLGEESWEDAQTGRIANVYYWRDQAAVQQLMQLPQHLEAKAAQARWLDGYQVIVAQILHQYGDGKLAHPLSSTAAV